MRWEEFSAPGRGVRLHVRRVVEPSAPPVLLLHGLGHWTDGAWGRLVPQLDPALRYVAFDLPGFGASDGISVAQTGCAFGQRVWKRQAGGGEAGLGTSPRSGSGRRRAPGRGSGTADRSAPV